MTDTEKIIAEVIKALTLISFICLILFVPYFTTQQATQNMESQVLNWPQTDGVITDSQVGTLSVPTYVEGQRVGSSLSYLPEISYEYIIQGKKYTSNQISPINRVEFSTEEEAEEFLSDYQVGDQVTVYYNIDDYDEAYIYVREGKSIHHIPVLIGAISLLLLLPSLPWFKSEINRFLLGWQKKDHKIEKVIDNSNNKEQDQENTVSSTESTGINNYDGGKLTFNLFFILFVLSSVGLILLTFFHFVILFATYFQIDSLTIVENIEFRFTVFLFSLGSFIVSSHYFLIYLHKELKKRWPHKTKKEVRDSILLGFTILLSGFLMPIFYIEEFQDSSILISKIQDLMFINNINLSDNYLIGIVILLPLFLHFVFEILDNTIKYQGLIFSITSIFGYYVAVSGLFLTLVGTAFILLIIGYCIYGLIIVIASWFYSISYGIYYSINLVPPVNFVAKQIMLVSLFFAVVFLVINEVFIKKYLKIGKEFQENEKSLEELGTF